jgi:hypothetical protein
MKQQKRKKKKERRREVRVHNVYRKLLCIIIKAEKWRGMTVLFYIS